MGLFSNLLRRKKEAAQEQIKAQTDQLVKSGTQAIRKHTSDIMRGGALALRIVTLASSAATSLLFGFFLSIGLPFFQLIDKTSMLSSMFFYGAILSVIYAPLSIFSNIISGAGGPRRKIKKADPSSPVPADDATDEMARAPEPARQKPGFRMGWLGWWVPTLAVLLFCWWVLGLELGFILLLTFLALNIIIAFLSGVVFLVKKITQQAQDGNSETTRAAHFSHRWARRLTMMVLMAGCFGFLRGEALKYQAPDINISLKDNQKGEKVTVIMNAQSGVLAFSGSSSPRPVRFYPWSSISAMQSSHSGQGYTIRPWVKKLEKRSCDMLANHLGSCPNKRQD